MDISIKLIAFFNGFLILLRSLRVYILKQLFTSGSVNYSTILTSPSENNCLNIYYIYFLNREYINCPLADYGIKTSLKVISLKNWTIKSLELPDFLLVHFNFKASFPWCFPFNCFKTLILYRREPGQVAIVSATESRLRLTPEYLLRFFAGISNFALQACLSVCVWLFEWSSRKREILVKPLFHFKKSIHSYIFSSRLFRERL